jgi:Fe-S cluster assembly protein SufB
MPDSAIERPELDSLGVYEFGWSDTDAAGQSARRGINTEVVTNISNL